MPKLRAQVLTAKGTLSAKEKKRVRPIVVMHDEKCTRVVDAHIEYNQENGWRMIHRCKCGAEIRSDNWHSELSAVERLFWAQLHDEAAGVSHETAD